jgi:hypothetical protein
MKGTKHKQEKRGLEESKLTVSDEGQNTKAHEKFES